MPKIRSLRQPTLFVRRSARSMDDFRGVMNRYSNWLQRRLEWVKDLDEYKRNVQWLKHLPRGRLPDSIFHRKLQAENQVRRIEMMLTRKKYSPQQIAMLRHARKMPSEQFIEAVERIIREFEKHSSENMSRVHEWRYYFQNKKHYAYDRLLLPEEVAQELLFLVRFVQRGGKPSERIT